MIQSADPSRVRGVFRRLYDNLILLPTLFVLAGAIAGFSMVRADDAFDSGGFPTALRTSPESADTILATIAGGLISATTLLLSITLIAVQLASSQYSPRTIRDWIGDRTQQVTISLVLGTSVYCLMALRESRSVRDDSEITRDLTVAVGVISTFVCLIAVVHSVGHLSNRMRVDSLATSIMNDTIAAIRRHGAEGGGAAPASRTEQEQRLRQRFRADDGWRPLTADRAGWFIGVDHSALAKAAAPDARVRMAVPVGAFVLNGAPIAHVERANDNNEANDRPAGEMFRIGQERTIEADPAYGILQLSDIALRAISPGVNDPNTAADVVVYLGMVLLSIWELPEPSRTVSVEGRFIEHRGLSHRGYLDAAFDQIIRYGVNDVDVLATVLLTIDQLIGEVERRNLPGPQTPFVECREWILGLVESGSMCERDKQRLIEDYAQNCESIENHRPEPQAPSSAQGRQNT